MHFGAFGQLPIRLGGQDPTIGWTARAHARAAADLAAVVRSLPIAVITWTKSGATLTATGYNAMHGIGVQVAATLSDGGTGITIIDWSTQYLDAYEIADGFSIRGHKATAHGATGLTTATELVTAVRVRVRTRLMSTGALTDPTAGVTLAIWS